MSEIKFGFYEFFVSATDPQGPSTSSLTVFFVTFIFFTAIRRDSISEWNDLFDWHPRLFEGASRGLQLTLNIEEYERMMGSHVASGIHILIHNKREYPLVEQLGQAIAAGSHTFVALKLKKVDNPTFIGVLSPVVQLTDFLVHGFSV